MFNFSGKKILVTGAASGIGRATTIMLSKLGAHCLLMDVNEHGLNETKRILDLTTPPVFGFTV